MAWVALVPLLLALTRSGGRPHERRRHPALLGLLTGGLWFFGTLYWTADVLAIFGGVNAVLSWLLCGLLVAYLALYPAAFAWITARVVQAAGLRALALAPCIWVGTEWVRGTLFSGFPWVLLGYSQSGVASVIQTASLLSVHGVSALIVLAGVAVVWLWQEGRRALWRSGLSLALVLACVAWGAYRVAEGSLTTTGEPVRVGIVQGNVPQEQKWDPAYRDDILGRYLRLTQDVVRRGATLVLWPESSTPFFLGRDQARTEAIRAAVHDAGIHLVVGSDDVAPEGAPHYNAAFMIGPNGATDAVYHKMQLVPFGEYIPMRRLLFFAQPLVEGVADFAPGEEMTLLPVGERRLSVAVCYEVVFPWHGLLAARTGSQLLTTITNDAWYGTTSAPYQHFEQARVRAVETGRYLVRAANTGISAVIDPYGRVVTRTALFETATIVADVRWRTTPTVYLRIGDSFVYACLVITGLAIVISVRTNRGAPRDSHSRRRTPPL